MCSNKFEDYSLTGNMNGHDYVKTLYGFYLDVNKQRQIGILGNIIIKK